jgi:radial spoke head protein 4A
VEEEEGDWNLRQLPGAARAEGEEGGLVVVRSLRWPGACSIGFGKRFANVYVGYGHRHAAEAYAPPEPAEVQGEFDVTALAEEATFEEGVDVAEDPDAGAPAEGEEEDE